MNGRAFSWLMPMVAASTSARREAISGRLVSATAVRSSSPRPGSSSVIWVWSCSSGSTTARVEPQHAREPRALDAPLLPRRDRLLLEVGDHVAGAINFVGRDEVASEFLDFLDQLAGEADGVKSAPVDASILMDQEVSVRGLHQGVVFRPLGIPVPGVEHLTRHQRLVNRVGRMNDAQIVPPEARPAVEEVGAGGGHDALVEVGSAAVVSDVIEADVQVGEPEHLRAGQLGLGDPDAGLRRGDDERTGVGEPQGSRQSDRKPAIFGREGSGIQARRDRER